MQQTVTISTKEKLIIRPDLFGGFIYKSVHELENLTHVA